MAIERAGAVKFEGNPLTLVGPELKVGDQAPDFKVTANDFSEVTLATDSGKLRLLLSLTSLDTPLCDAETKRFDSEAVRFPENVIVYAVSCDLPFAQKRWCDAADPAQVKSLSDHRDLLFGQAYGTLIKEWRLLSRAVFLVDKNNILQYVEYVPTIGQHPNYAAVVETIRQIERA